MNWIIGCEESQRVTIALREKGIKAYSCDLLPASGGREEWHIQDDILKVAKSKVWDAGIFFPPCTDICVSGTNHFEKKRANGSQEASINFFLDIVALPIKNKAIENPIGIMSGGGQEYIRKYFPELYKKAQSLGFPRKPDQIIQPYQFGDPLKKSTCLWIWNFPLLIPTNIVQPEFVVYKSSKTKSGTSKYSVLGKLGKSCGMERSKTFPGIANAIADQWGKTLLA